MKLNEKGLTLVETIASLLIITIVLISIAQLIIQSNKTTAINNEKLVAIDLAETVLERLKAENQIVKEAIELADPDADDIEIPLTNINLENLSTQQIDGKDCYFIEINQDTYQIEAHTIKPENTNVENLGLRPVIITVDRVKLNTSNGKSVIEELIGKSEIEGYVEL